MAVTLVSSDRATIVQSALERDGELWLSFEDLAASTGWEHKPQGLCLGERCVPVHAARANEWVAADGRFNVSAFSRYLDVPVVHDDAASVWLLGESAAERERALRSLDAPDFRLPDLDGRTHALSEYRGKKVLLLSWASW